jgi:hypothetical protein
MAFGTLNVVQCVRYGLTAGDLFMPIAGILVGGVWFAVGWYGGLPLVATVDDWRPPAAPDEVSATHRQGLLVMRRRRWLTWASVVVWLVGGLALAVWLDHPRYSPIALIVLGVPIVVVQLMYRLSRCPRCGYGFFARGKGRAAFLTRGHACRQCGLSLTAYKDQRAS